jgi:hypothetical protein
MICCGEAGKFGLDRRFDLLGIRCGKSVLVGQRAARPNRRMDAGRSAAI